MSITILSGPVGAGGNFYSARTLTDANGRVSHIEGDTFWQFVATAHSQDAREVFQVIIRAMIAAAIPFSRAGYHVLIDFSISPQFLPTARKIVKEEALNYVVVLPSFNVLCGTQPCRLR